METDAYFLVETPSPLLRRPLPLAEPGPDEALVEVEACGLCHTDLSFADGSVRPRHPLPLVLGHEVTGRVIAAGERFAELVGRPVLVPAVLPCGECAFCRAGRGNACPHQKMPGNDIHGGFARHLLVPAAPLVPLDGAPPGLALADLAVVADAVSTAYQAVWRAGVAAGDAAVVVGAGGVGSFVVQIARALGARVAACDVDAARLATVAAHGAERTVAIDGKDARAVRQELRAVVAEWGVPSLHLRIFECSGAAAGQELAFSLLDRAATLVQVGYGRDKVAVRLSNLMAYDATVHGSWGCPPERIPAALEMIYDGRVTLGDFVDHAPMSELNHLLDEMAHHRLKRRMVLHPEG